jgi:hypothetical protein
MAVHFIAQLKRQVGEGVNENGGLCWCVAPEKDRKRARSGSDLSLMRHRRVHVEGLVVKIDVATQRHLPQ